MKFARNRAMRYHFEDIENERQENAKNAFAEWLEKKRNASTTAGTNQCDSVTMPEPEVKTFIKDSPPHVSWLKKKNKLEQEKKERESSNRKVIELNKKTQVQNAIEMYEKWLAQSKYRNKPVRFGQGLRSMYHTSTAIYNGIFIMSGSILDNFCSQVWRVALPLHTRTQMNG